MTDDTALLVDLVCRKSQAVKSKAGRREISVSAQEARGRRTAAELGLTVRHVWREVGSASRFRRSRKVPQQDLALMALERGEVGALWIFRVDRWTRRGAGAVLAIVEPADGRPRRLLVDNGDSDNPGVGLDSSNPRDRSELIRRAEDAREETEILSERVLNTKSFQRENGEWINNRPPYGLKVVLITVTDDDGDEIDERKLAVDTDTSAGIPGEPDVTKSDIARWITHGLPITGLSNRKITAALNARGVPSSTGKTWQASVVYDMQRNPAYAGWQVAGREEGRPTRMLYRNAKGDRVSVMSGPPLLSDAEYTAAQGTQRNTVAYAKGSWVATHLLTDLLECAGCTASCTWQGKGYRCWRYGSGGVCPAPAYAAGPSAERWVFERWSGRMSALEPDDPLLTTVARRWAARVEPGTGAERREALAVLSDAESALARLWRDRRGGLYDGPSESFFAPALAEANSAVVDAQALVRSAQPERAVDIGWLLEPEDLHSVWEAADLPLRRDLLRLSIRKIRLCKADYDGQHFNGAKRMEIIWHDSEVAQA